MRGTSKLGVRWLRGVLAAAVLLSASSAEAGLSGNCRQEFKKLCPGQKLSRKAIKQCFEEKRAQLSQECVAHLDKVTKPGQFLTKQKNEKMTEAKSKFETKRADLKGQAGSKEKDLEAKAKSAMKWAH